MSADPGAGVTAALLLARWWSRPTGDEQDVWDGLWSQAQQAARALGCEPDAIERLRDAAAEGEPDALSDEYERLLVGPGRAPCLPYESAWGGSTARRPGNGELMGAAAEQVQAVYGELGLQLRTDGHELPDHLVVEWEALACALERRAPTAAAFLLDEHLGRWMVPFCAAVAAETELPFYRELAQITPAWTAALAP